MRAFGPERHFLVLRKSLYAYRISRRGGGVELLHNRQEIEDLMQHDGVRFVVVADNMQLGFDSQRELRDLLKTPQFKIMGTFPLYDSELGRANGNLRVYENRAWAPPTDKYLRIKMLTLNRDIVVPLDMFAGGKN
jgi:hypothetical protein